MMNGMMLLFLDLIVPIMFHLLWKMQNSLNQVLMEMNMLRLTLVSRLPGSVKPASVMSLKYSAATPVLFGTCQKWTWRLVNLLITNMVGASTARPNSIRFGINLKTWPWICVDYQSLSKVTETLGFSVLPWSDEMASQPGKRVLAIASPHSGFAYFTNRYKLDSRKWDKIKM